MGITMNRIEQEAKARRPPAPEKRYGAEDEGGLPMNVEIIPAPRCE